MLLLETQRGMKETTGVPQGRPRALARRSYGCPTNNSAPAGVVALPADACTATTPAGTVGGNWMVTWYNPAVPAVSTALITGTATPPTVTVGVIATAGEPLTATPAGAGGFVAP